METEQLLRRLGATGNLTGFHYAIYMIELVEQDPSAATLVTKYLYPRTAKEFHVSPGSVERSLRTLIHTSWNRGDWSFWDEVAGTHLSHSPTNGMFLDMTASYLRRHRKP